MPEDERRRAARITCRVPVSLVWAERRVAATVVDLSARGAGIQVGSADLLGEPTDDVMAVARVLCEAVPNSLVIQFRPEVAERMVRRRAQVCRLGLGAKGGSTIELGCWMAPPLGVAEAIALGVAVPLDEEALDTPFPPPAVEPPDSPPPSPPPPPADPVGRADRPPEPPEAPLPVLDPGRFSRLRPRLNAVLSHGPGRLGRAVEGYTEHIDPEAVVVLVTDRTVLGLAPETKSVGGLLAEFCESYGEAPVLALRDRDAEVWRGEMRIQSIELLPRSPDALLLGFSFAERLTLEERRALGLS